MIVICNGEVLTIWPHYLSVLTSFNFCCPLYPKWYILINDENILICFVSIIWKWRPINGAVPSQFSLAIKSQIDGWGFKVQNLKMDFINGGILLFTAARLIRIKIINCLYSQNPFSNFWLKTPNLLLPTLCIYWSIIS